MISKQKEIFNELVDERLDEITELDEKVNTDDLICKYKGYTANAKFRKFGNALSLIDKIKEDEISLADANKLYSCSKLLRRRIKFNKSF